MSASNMKLLIASFRTQEKENMLSSFRINLLSVLSRISFSDWLHYSLSIL